MSTTNLNFILTSAFKDVGITFKVTCNTLRKLAVNSVAMGSPDMRGLVAYCMGHSTMTAEGHYVHLNKVDAIKKTQNILKLLLGISNNQENLQISNPPGLTTAAPELTAAAAAIVSSEGLQIVNPPVLTTAASELTAAAAAVVSSEGLQICNPLELTAAEAAELSDSSISEEQSDESYKEEIESPPKRKKLKVRVSWDVSHIKRIRQLFKNYFKLNTNFPKMSKIKEIIVNNKEPIQDILDARLINIKDVKSLEKFIYAVRQQIRYQFHSNKGKEE